MTRLWGSLVAIAAVFSFAPAARAEDTSPFAVEAAKAQRVSKLDRMVWALTATCEQGDDIARRQCRMLRDAAAQRMKGAVMYVDVAPTMFEVGAYDKTGGGSTLEVRGCVSCAGVVVDGAKWVVVSNKAVPTVTGDKVQAALLWDSIKTFKDEAAAIAWRNQLAPRLRAEMIIRIPADKPATFQRNGLQGIAVDVVGYRVYDACDGTVLAASPESGPGVVDKKTCGTSAADKAKPEVLPAELTKAQVVAGMKPAVVEAKKCQAKFGKSGDAKVKVVIGGDGTVHSVEQTGDFAGTETGQCIEDAIKTATFPKSKKQKTTVSYPIPLR
jgi:hypothetical protein